MGKEIRTASGKIWIRRSLDLDGDAAAELHFSLGISRAWRARGHRTCRTPDQAWARPRVAPAYGRGVAQVPCSYSSMTAMSPIDHVLPSGSAREPRHAATLLLTYGLTESRAHPLHARARDHASVAQSILSFHAASQVSLYLFGV